MNHFKSTFTIISVIFMLLILSSCSLEELTKNVAEINSKADRIIPDLVKELPTKIDDLTKDIPDTAMEAYWGGDSTGDMEWHSRVMLNGVRLFADILMKQIENSGLDIPEPGDDSVSVTLNSIDFMNTSYSSIIVTFTAIDDYILIEGYAEEQSPSNQIIRYIAIPDDTGKIIKGYFVWVNATEYQLPHSDDPSVHEKEVVEVKFDVSDSDNKILRVDTVHWHHGANKFYGFILKSTFNESTHTGTGQYVEIIKDVTDALTHQNYTIMYNLDTKIKCVGEYDESTSSIIATKQFGTDNQPTGDTCTMSVSDLGFTPLTSSDDVPVPYDYDNANSRITNIINNWDSYVTRDNVGF